MNDVIVKEIITTLLYRLKDFFSKSWLYSPNNEESELVSLSLIGRDPNYRRIDQILDFDIVIILKGQMSQEKFDEVDNIVQNIQNYSNPNISITYKIADGPIKPMINKSVNLFLHILLHTLESYKNSPLLLVKNSWQYDGHKILGAELREIQSIKQPSIDVVINGKLGLNHCVELITSKASAYLVWEKQNAKLLNIALKTYLFIDAHELQEICYYSVLRGASNALRFTLGHSWGIGIEYSDMKKFAEVFFDFKLKNYPLKVWQEKVRIRQGKWQPSATEMMITIEQTLEFLNLLIKTLKGKNPIYLIYGIENQ